MALRSLELRNAIDSKKKELVSNERKLEGFKTREAELIEKVNAADSDELRTSVEEEVDEFNAEKAELEASITALRESIAQMEEELAQMEANEPSNKPEIIEENLRKEGKEMIKRDSLEYNQAFLRGVKSGNFDECRSLITEEQSGGQIPVPTQLETEIKTAWETSAVMGLVKKSYFKGNVKVGFEISATDAVVHVEGAAAPTEETITLGAVELKAQNIKKWITVSDEALEGTSIDTMRYLYKEIAHKIVAKAEAVAIAAIIAQPATADATHPGAPTLGMNPAADTIVKAVALLSGEASDLHIVMNRATYPEFVALALNAGYAIDVFDGLKERIVFSDAVKAYSAASTNDTYAIVGDFADGFQANFPNGNDVTLLVDPYSLAEKDLVKVVGRQYVGMGVVAPKRFTRICKVATA